MSRVTEMNAMQGVLSELSEYLVRDPDAFVHTRNYYTQLIIANHFVGRTLFPQPRIATKSLNQGALEIDVANLPTTYIVVEGTNNPPNMLLGRYRIDASYISTVDEYYHIYKYEQP